MDKQDYIAEIYKHPDEKPVFVQFDLKKRNDVYAKKMATEIAFKECNGAWFFAVYLLVREDGDIIKTYNNEPSCYDWKIKWDDSREKCFAVDLWRKHYYNRVIK